MVDGEKCLHCGRASAYPSCGSFDGEHIWPSEEYLEHSNPHESDDDRIRRVEAFAGWAERGFFVGCA